KEDVVQRITEYASQFTSRKIKAQMNAADNIENGSVYLTVTGTSAEMGDDGAVGRGNRPNGLITPGRPMSLEATSGKNPINHVGKIYNLMAMVASKEIAEEVDGIEEIYIRILSQIGRPIDQPHMAGIQIVSKENADFDKVKTGAKELLDDWLENITNIQKMIFKGELSTY
ncbi:MAG: methionine adenosyltransferase, partial [Methanotrichaceae archaeon]|nr:methionine adenosyltransferase [Methanotrichaceae archaeon]